VRTSRARKSMVAVPGVEIDALVLLSDVIVSR
jgi:hypothetical protein